MNKKEKTNLIYYLPLIIFLTIGFIDKTNIIDNTKSYFKLKPYIQQVENCINNTDQKVIGNDISCAKEIGKKIYEKDPESAIQLCKKYSFVNTFSKETSESVCKNFLELELN